MLILYALNSLQGRLKRHLVFPEKLKIGSDIRQLRPTPDISRIFIEVVNPCTIHGQQKRRVGRHNDLTSIEADTVLQIF